MHIFNARLEIIGINPFVYVPKDILTDIFMKAGKNKGGIPVCGSILDKPFTQTLVRYSGEWRLYINTTASSFATACRRNTESNIRLRSQR